VPATVGKLAELGCFCFLLSIKKIFVEYLALLSSSPASNMSAPVQGQVVQGQVVQGQVVQQQVVQAGVVVGAPVMAVSLRPISLKGTATV
jgi:hypothetical protein